MFTYGEAPTIIIEKPEKEYKSLQVNKQALRLKTLKRNKKRNPKD